MKKLIEKAKQSKWVHTLIFQEGDYSSFVKLWRRFEIENLRCNVAARIIILEKTNLLAFLYINSSLVFGRYIPTNLFVTVYMFMLFYNYLFLFCLLNVVYLFCYCLSIFTVSWWDDATVLLNFVFHTNRNSPSFPKHISQKNKKYLKNMTHPAIQTIVLFSIFLIKNLKNHKNIFARFMNSRWKSIMHFLCIRYYFLHNLLLANLAAALRRSASM